MKATEEQTAKAVKETLRDFGYVTEEETSPLTGVAESRGHDRRIRFLCYDIQNSGKTTVHLWRVHSPEDPLSRELAAGFQNPSVDDEILNMIKAIRKKIESFPKSK